MPQDQASAQLDFDAIGRALVALCGTQHALGHANASDTVRDEEIASEVAGTVEDTVAVIDGETWRGVWSFGILAQLLDATEQEGHAGAVRVLEAARGILERYGGHLRASLLER